MYMIIFKIKDLLEKNKISRYKMRIYLDWNYKRVNDYYFGRVKDIKTSEIEQLCELFKCDITDLFEYKKK
ncbi:MAG: XRE family transcriptional regulator [Clostridiales bacterium]|nr:XRE family transcriptional regulator [Clostridiales bacterium]